VEIPVSGDPGLTYGWVMSELRCPTCSARNRVGAIPRGVPRCGRCQKLLPWLVTADSVSFDEEATASVPVVVDLWAPWCVPCQMIAPALADLAANHTGRVKVVKVNVDEEPGLGARFHARSIPLLVVLRDGHEVDRITGALSRQALEARLAPLLA
jgi:thioredoxin 2